MLLLPTPVASPLKTTIDLLETPGQVAADSNPLKATDLSVGALPDESLPGSVTHRATAVEEVVEIPLATNEAQIQKLTANSLNVPGMIKSSPPVSSLTISSLPTKNINYTAPIKLDPPNTVRHPIANPYDILDR